MIMIGRREGGKLREQASGNSEESFWNIFVSRNTTNIIMFNEIEV